MQEGKRDLSMEVESVINKHEQVGAPKEQGGGLLDGRLLRRNIRDQRGFWLNLSDRILAESRLR